MLLTGGGGGRVACRVCGQPHTTCGPEAAASTTPVDLLTMEEVHAMGERRKYRARVNGYDTVLNLTAAEAEKFYPEATLVTPATMAPKARTVPNKARPAAANK